MDHERHVYQLLVRALRVAHVAVIPELVAVIGDDDDGRGVVEPGRLEVGQEHAEGGVALGDLGVVQGLEIGLVGVVHLELPLLDLA